MKVADHRFRDLAVDHAAATLALVDILRASRAAEWEPPTASKLMTATGVYDPVGETATATSRLVLRARVEEALAAIEAATATFRIAVDELETAFAHHTDPYARHSAHIVV